jgi:RNA polymerase sigma-70 factor, ECF subfamily
MDELDRQVVEQIPRLRRYARALTGDGVAADDLVQDCLERALSRLHRWRRGSDLRAWLFTIMHHLYVNSVRRRMGGPGFVPLADGLELPSVAATQELTLEIGDLDAGLAALPPEQREVLLLVGLEEMRYDQVASVLGIPVGTVMSRLHRARERLRRHLAGSVAPAPAEVKSDPHSVEVASRRGGTVTPYRCRSAGAVSADVASGTPGAVDPRRTP